MFMSSTNSDGLALQQFRLRSRGGEEILKEISCYSGRPKYSLLKLYKSAF